MLNYVFNELDIKCDNFGKVSVFLTFITFYVYLC